MEGAHTGAGALEAEIGRLLDNPTSRTAWRILARNRVRGLFDALREAEQTQQLDAGRLVQVGLIREGLHRAAAAACFKPAGREALKDWYSGAAVETTWTELHRAEERLLLVADPALVLEQVATIDAALRSNLKEDDPRLTLAAERLKAIGGLAPNALTPHVREELRSWQEIANTAGDEAHENVRSLRNLLIVVGMCVTIGCVAVSLLHALAPSFLDLAGPGGNGGRRPDAPEVWEVVVVGALGGMIAAVFTISKLGGFSGPYRLPVYQSLIRVPAGAIVALAAVVLLQSGQIQALSPQSGLSVLAVALLFGYAPDVLLRFMDQKATALLAQAQSKNDPSRPALAQPRARS